MGLMTLDAIRVRDIDPSDVDKALAASLDAAIATVARALAPVAERVTVVDALAGLWQPTTQSIAATRFPASRIAFSTVGYAALADGGGATFARVAAAPAHPGYVVSADGAIWEIVDSVVTPDMFGPRDAIQSWTAAAATGRPIRATGAAYDVTAATAADTIALMDILSRLTIEGAGVTLRLAAGVTNIPATTNISVVNGFKLKVYGAPTVALTGASLVSIVSTGSTAHDVTFSFSNASQVAVGDYIAIKKTSGVNSRVLDGAWRVTAVNGGYVTVRNTAKSVDINPVDEPTTLTGGTFFRFSTVLNYTSTAWIVRTPMGANSEARGLFDQMILVGPGRAVGAYYGMLIEYGCTLTTMGSFAVTSFSRYGYYLIYGAALNAYGSIATDCGQSGVYTLDNSTCQFVNAISNGNADYGFVMSVGSVGAGTGSTACGNSVGLFLSGTSHCTAWNGHYHFNTTYGVSADLNSTASIVGVSARYNGLHGARAASAAVIDATGASSIRDSGVVDVIQSDGSSRVMTTAGTFGTQARASGFVSVALTFGSVAAGATVTLDVAAPGALSIGTTAALSYNGADTALDLSARVAAPDVIRITAVNRGASSVVLGTRTYTVSWTSL